MKNTKTKLKAAVSILSSVIILFGLFVAPLGSAKTAYALTCDSATLTGTVQTNRPPTQAWFQWGKNGNVTNNSTPAQTFNSSGTFPIEAFISGLRESTTYSYQLVAQDSYGVEYGSIRTFTTPACQQQNPPTVSITADQTNISYNGSTTVRWSSTNATSCTASGGTNGWANGSNNRGTSGSFATGNLTYTVAYSITCTNSTGQTASDSVTVSVGSQPPQTCQDSSATNYGGPLPCRYQAQTCQDPSATNYGGPLPCRYPTQTCQDPSATNYGGPLPCRYAPQTCQDPSAINYGGQLPCRYQQQNPPTVSITADQTNISYNGSTTVRWSSTNAMTCNGSGGTNGWAGSRSVPSGSFFTGNLTTNTTYNITCSNSTGSASDSVTVYVTAQPPQTCQDPSATNYGGPLPCRYAPQTCQDPSATNYGGQLPCRYQQPVQPTVSLTADDTNINSGDSTILRWFPNNATSCSGSGGTNGWSGSKSPSGGSFFTGALTTTRTYTITCSNNSGSASDSVTVFVDENNNERVTVNIRADDTSIDSGDSTIIRWSSTNADTCRSSGGSNGWARSSRPTSGSFNTGDLTRDTTYSITCENENGSADANDSVRVNVSDNNDGDPTVNISANPSSLQYNGTSTITWYSNNADSCRASGGTNGWSGNRSLSGSFFTGSLTNTVSFSINCTKDNGSDSASTTVFVSGQPQQPPVNNQPTVVIYADQTNIAFNAATTVRWNTTNATSCFASGGSVGWAGTKSIGPGSFFTGSLTGTRTYTITCSNDVGSSTDSVTVNVRGQVLGTSTTVPARTSLVLVTSSVDRNQPIVPTLDNTNPCPGDEINYTITYQNIGTGAISNLTLRVDLPAAVDYLSSNPSNPNISGNTLIFSLGTLRANGQGTVTVRTRVRNNVPAGSSLNFPAVLSYVDPSGFPQSVAANVSASVCGTQIGQVSLGANVFGAGFLPTSIFGWLLLLILILILVLLARYLFGQSFRRKVVTMEDHPSGARTTTTTIQ